MRADPLHDYDLTQALILLGQRMYGDEWSGNHNELQLASWNYETPLELKAKYDDLDRKIADLESKVREQNELIKKSVSEKVINTAEAEKARLYDQRSYLHSKKNELPTYGEGFEREYETYQRRSNAEQTLVKALATKELSFWCRGSTPSEDGPWTGKPGYKYSIELSLIRWHSRDSSVRWQPVRVYRENFDEWLKTIPPVSVGANAELSIEDQAKFWFMGQVVNPPSPRPKRNEYIDVMQVKFPGLSGRAALRIWETCAPQSWRSAGRTKKN